MQLRIAITLGIVTMAASAAAETARSARPASLTIVHPSKPSALNIRAAREIARYVYVRTGHMPAVTDCAPPTGDVVVLGNDSGSLDAQAFALSTQVDGNCRVLRIRGGSDVATLYGAYRFAELIGVRFYLHGDVIPDRPLDSWRLPIVQEDGSPLFPVRGIQPFHDFTEGPDWWELDAYKAYLSQLAKMRMNFLGLHCYPEGHAGPEPLVWIGLPDDVDANGRVRFSYPSRWASTQGGAWGYAPMKTSEFAAGASLLFARDDYGPSVTEGHRPKPTTPEGCNEVFNRAALLLAEVVKHGRELGIKTCVGTETPLTIPKEVQERLRQRGMDPADPGTVRALYTGMFTRIARAYPVDYYWLWTPEGWTWSGASTDLVEATVRDFHHALAALEAAGRPFEFATCGWVLGPPSDRALFDKVLPPDAALSCINRDVGFEPVEPGFALVKERPQWAIPWLEDDPAMIIPQLWAGRMRRDAADALAYGCTGLIGIHWRTRVIGPTLSALSQAAWAQKSWNPDFGKPLDPPKVLTTDVHVGGSTANHGRQAIVGTDDDPVYETCRWNVDAYRIQVPNGRYRVTLQFSEIHYREVGKRVFGIRLENEQVADRLDVFARVGPLAPLDLSFENVTVADGELNVDFVRQVEFPFIAGIVVVGRPADADPADPPFVRRINCGGGAYESYVADLPAAGLVVTLRDRPRDLPVRDFYEDWARAQFGPEVSKEIAAIFARMDGSPVGGGPRASNLPRPSDWDRGPGGIKAVRTPWETERQRYRFLRDLGELRPRVVGKGNLARFEYWLCNFFYLREIGHVGCLRGELDAVMERINAERDPDRQRRMAKKEALPLRIQLAKYWIGVLKWQLAVVSNPGEIGTIANLEQHVRTHNQFLSLHDKRLVDLLGPLPTDTKPTLDYHQPPRMFLPVVRTDVRSRESLTFDVILLSALPTFDVDVHYRDFGQGDFRSHSVGHINRGVYRASLPACDGIGFEYYLTATGRAGETLVWPATAPDLNQTVIVVPD
jgi:hypothetical protein